MLFQRSSSRLYTLTSHPNPLAKLCDLPPAQAGRSRFDILYESSKLTASKLEAARAASGTEGCTFAPLINSHPSGAAGGAIGGVSRSRSGSVDGSAQRPAAGGSDAAPAASEDASGEVVSGAVAGVEEDTQRGGGSAVPSSSRFEKLYQVPGSFLSSRYGRSL